MDKHHSRKLGIGETRDPASTGRERTHGVGNFLQGGGAGNSIELVRDMGPFGVNGKAGRGDTHTVPATDHREARDSIREQYMGDTGGGRRTRGSGNTVSKDLHRETAGNRGVVGGATYIILCV